jgi:hypothetical protein
MNNGMKIVLALIVLSITTFSSAAAERGWLGIYTDPVRELPEIEQRLGGNAALEEASCGLRISAVFPDSPAETGGLLEDDLIIALFGEPLTCPFDSVRIVFRASFADQPPGTHCVIRVIRSAVDRQLSRHTRTTHRAGNIDSDSEPELGRTQRITFWRTPDDVIATLSSGDSLAASVTKHQAVLDLDIILGSPPEAAWAPCKTNAEIFPASQFPVSGFAPLLWSLADEYNLRGDTEDLLARLEACHETADPFRLECLSYVHRDPFRLESVSQHLVSNFKAARFAADLIADAAEIWVPDYQLKTPGNQRLIAPELVSADNATRAQQLKPLIDQINQIFTEARQWHRRAFAALSEEELQFIERERWNISDVLASDTYIHLDSDKIRFAKNKHLIDLATRIDYGALIESAARLALLTDPEWAMHAGRLVQQVFADTLATEILHSYDSPFGTYLFGGTSRHWYRQTDVAFILDLGGNDFYTGNCGGGSSLATPHSVCIDLDGDDAYESTIPGCQGAGCLGIGALLDFAGDDSYIANQWCQGTGYFGIGWLHDLSGDDIYRGHTFTQATALFGLGFLLDESGNDRYSGDGHVQAVGLPKGVGALIDCGGDDQYYAKGLYPTGYGDAGIFDSWSQGCGQGLRTLASGGLGILVDISGSDLMEAGNFSQGGGYYYGYGIVAASGREDDRYIGSRYNQGFCAHQAVGVFLEEGGDDFYTTRQAVAQGLAWDECVTLFIDLKGNDTYQGGTGFSQGASAHNSFCFFLDRDGRDSYDYPPGQARAGGNDYHGGTSFSLFLDEGGKRDRYNAELSQNNRIYYSGAHGFFLDIPGRYSKVISPDNRLKLMD